MRQILSNLASSVVHFDYIMTDLPTPYARTLMALSRRLQMRLYLGHGTNDPHHAFALQAMSKLTWTSDNLTLTDVC